MCKQGFAGQIRAGEVVTSKWLAMKLTIVAGGVAAQLQAI